jgi:hypothetical protein
MQNFFQRIEAIKQEAEKAAKAEVDASVLAEMKGSDSASEHGTEKSTNPYSDYKEHVRNLEARSSSATGICVCVCVCVCVCFVYAYPLSDRILLFVPAWRVIFHTLVT